MSAQLEDGYTRIANEIVEALARMAPGFTEMSVLWCVLRKTYGWNKKSDNISISQLVQMSGRSKRMVIYALQNLEAKRMITIERKFRETNRITFNKNHHEWLPDATSKQYKKLHLVQKVAPSATSSDLIVQHSVKNVQEVAHTKETKQKTIQKKESLFASNEAVILSFFGNLEVSDKKIIELATKYDVRPKDVVFVLRELITYKSEKGEMIDDVLLQANKSLNLALRWHKIKTLSDKEEVETAKSKTKTNAEDEWIKTIKFVGG